MLDEELAVLWVGEEHDAWMAFRDALEGLVLALPNVELAMTCEVEPRRAHALLFDVEGDLDVEAAVAWLRAEVERVDASGSVALVHTPGQSAYGQLFDVSDAFLAGAAPSEQIAREGKVAVIQGPGSALLQTRFPSFLRVPGTWRAAGWPAAEVDGAPLSVWTSLTDEDPAWLFVLGSPTGAPVDLQRFVEACGLRIDGMWSPPGADEGFSGDSYGTADWGAFHGIGWVRGSLGILCAAATPEQAEALVLAVKMVEG